MTEEEASQLRNLAERLLGLSRTEGASLELQPVDSNLSWSAQCDVGSSRYSEDCLYHAARIELRRRKLRKNFFPAEWFSEGPWNVLIDLFENEYRDCQVSISCACIAADLPTSTAIRHIGQLIDADLVRRYPDPKDQRRSFLQLTPSGRRQVREVLGQMIDVEKSMQAEFDESQRAI